MLDSATPPRLKNALKHLSRKYLPLEQASGTIKRFSDINISYVPTMSAESVNLDLLFDADEYWRSGHCPWTFFAYPTTLAGAHGLPPDQDACRLLGAVQARGIDVGIWVNGISDNTTYFACKKDDIQRLNEVLEELENTDSFGMGFCAKRSEALFAILEHGT